jgi:hypothetical protein
MSKSFKATALFVCQFILLLLCSGLGSTGHASMSFQMERIRGDWDCGPRYDIARFQQQGNSSVKQYACRRDVYFKQNGYCEYVKLEIVNFNFDRDSLCKSGSNARILWPNGVITGGEEIPCSVTLQVSREFPNQLVGASGFDSVVECKRIR